MQDESKCVCWIKDSAKTRNYGCLSIVTDHSGRTSEHELKVKCLVCKFNVLLYRINNEK